MNTDEYLMIIATISDEYKVYYERSDNSIYYYMRDTIDEKTDRGKLKDTKFLLNVYRGKYPHIKVKHCTKRAIDTITQKVIKDNL